MTRYLCVPEAPVILEKGEFVVQYPDFKLEIHACRHRAGANKTCGVNQLRAIATLIGDRYDPEFNPYTNIRPAEYQGVAYADDDDLSKIVCRMFTNTYPKIFEKYIETQLKARPFGTKLIYFVGDHLFTTPFTANGIGVIDEKEVDTYMGRNKEKKQPVKAANKEKKEEIVSE